MSVCFGLYGAGGYGREVMPWAMDDAAFRAAQKAGTPITAGFIETDPKVAEVNRVPVYAEDAFFAMPCAERWFNVAVGDARVRKQIAERCMARGALPVSLYSPHAIVYDYTTIGHGAILSQYVIITANVRVGVLFHANLYAYVGHDCVIGDYVTFAPSVHCNGNVHIGDYAYIGTGAILRQGTSDRPLVIGEGAVVGMGAVVTKDVAPYTTVVGNPARELVRG